jgi:uncharacterized protein (TIGR02217 family)
MFSTSIFELASGHEKRNQNWEQQRLKWDIGFGIQRMEQLEAVIEFFYARRGRAYGFRFKDWSDFEIAGPQPIGVGAAGNTLFQVFKRYSPGLEPFDRIIRKVVADTDTVYVNGVETSAYTLNYATGLITFDSAVPDGNVVSVECEFDVPVRFDVDDLRINLVHFKAGSVPSVPVVELKQE